MEPGEPSRTAMMAATVRGLHRLEEATPWVFDDFLALVIVGPAWPDLRAQLSAALSEPILRVVSTMSATRARYTEERLAGGGFEQYVLLGAGLDSFAWRRPDALAKGLRVFEVDHPASQAWKLARVEDLGLPSNERHQFVPVDFEVETFDVGLDRAGFDRSGRTLFSWLGVLPYLTVEAIEATLRSFSKNSPGSEIALSYLIAPALMEDVGRVFHARWLDVAEKVGEPIQTALTPVEAEDLVRRCGLDVVDHPTRDDMQRRYFAGRADDLAPITFEQLMTAAVPGERTSG
jgi:methyltransferase (TIGR00027 family)